MENRIAFDRSQKTKLVTDSLKKAIDYIQYRELVAEHVANGTSTGPEQSDALANYTLLNHARMKRLDKTVRISEEIKDKFRHFNGDQTWLVLTESWCGDAAHAMPVMNVLAALAPKIDFKVVLRDENLSLMEAFLTHGTLSIPKLIVLDNNSMEVIAEWGPRPSIATRMVNDYKAKHGALTPEFKQDLQVWYNKNKSENIASDLAQLID